MRVIIQYPRILRIERKNLVLLTVYLYTDTREKIFENRRCQLSERCGQIGAGGGADFSFQFGQAERSAHETSVCFQRNRPAESVISHKNNTEK